MLVTKIFCLLSLKKKEIPTYFFAKKEKFNLGFKNEKFRKRSNVKIPKKNLMKNPQRNLKVPLCRVCLSV